MSSIRNLLKIRTLAVAVLMMMSAMVLAHPPAHAIEITTPKTVVELFTSQGCSSCPPADAALKEFNRGDGILGLALHVDYWDRLGWKDTFASPEHTKRQWLYARSLGERQVYTPQAIINGRTHLVGSRQESIQATADAFSAGGKGLSIPIEVSHSDDTISFVISPDTKSQKATLYAFYFSPLEQVKVKRGENAGRTLEYSNIVRKVEMIGMVGENGMSTTFSIADIKRKGFVGCALILQASTDDGYPGPILGASVITDL